MPADMPFQAHDIILKSIAPLFVGQSLAALGIDAPPAVSIAATEMPEVSVHAHDLDFLLELADESYLHLEFQSTKDARDLARFLVYDALLYQRDGRRIRTVVIYTGGVKRAADRVDAGSLRYQIENVYLGSIDGDQRLATLRARAATSGLGEDDAVDVALVMLMGHRAGTHGDVARQAVKLAAALPAPVSDRCTAAVMGLAVRYLTDDEFSRLMGERSVAKRYGEMLVEELAKGRAKGRAEGRAEGKAEDILVVLRERFGAVPESVAGRVGSQRDLGILDAWMVLALRAASLADFERRLI